MKIKLGGFTCFLVCFMVYSILVIYVTRVYVVRHCETEGNTKKIFQGHCDLPITKLGESQLAALSDRFDGIYLDKIYSSPLLRARRTGEAVKGKKDLEIIPYDDLIELNGGVLEGKSYEEIYNTFPGFKEMWLNNTHDFAPENGETMRAAYDRIWNAVLDIAKKNDGKTVAVTTHGGVVRCLLTRLLEGNIEKMVNVPWAGNTSVSLIEFDDQFNPTLKICDDTSHLGDDLKNPDAGIPMGDEE